MIFAPHHKTQNPLVMAVFGTMNLRLCMKYCWFCKKREQGCHSIPFKVPQRESSMGTQHLHSAQEQLWDIAFPGFLVNMAAVPRGGTRGPFTARSLTNKGNHSWRRFASFPFLLSLLCLELEVTGWELTWPGGRRGKGAAPPLPIPVPGSAACSQPGPWATSPATPEASCQEHPTVAAARLGVCEEGS